MNYKRKKRRIRTVSIERVFKQRPVKEKAVRNNMNEEIKELPTLVAVNSQKSAK